MGGRGGWRALVSRCNSVSAENEDMEAGIVPVSESPDSWRNLRADWRDEFDDKDWSGLLMF